ncbi:hypothetical protein NP493_904g00050 [Ridgeia piscesae]|uniref:Uncharacterized protein n=1 Tax=Ridgeia piscesae TaxID=27915 RepID=A0AAD9NLV6_RIDPI|nr:hypothetical protein NP493_904g00050 [Ridgeia piscesae]
MKLGVIRGETDHSRHLICLRPHSLLGTPTYPLTHAPFSAPCYVQRSSENTSPDMPHLCAASYKHLNHLSDVSSFYLVVKQDIPVQDAKARSAQL